MRIWMRRIFEGLPGGGRHCSRLRIPHVVRRCRPHMICCWLRAIGTTTRSRRSTTVRDVLGLGLVGEQDAGAARPGDSFTSRHHAAAAAQEGHSPGGLEKARVVRGEAPNAIKWPS